MKRLPVRIVLATSVLLGAATAQAVDDTHQFFHLQIAQVAANVHGLAFDVGERLFVSQSNATLTRLDLLTNVETTVLSGLPLGAPGQLACGDGRPLTGTDLVLADWNTELTASCCDGHVLRVDKVSGAFVSLAAGNPVPGSVGDPAGVALAPGGAWGTGVYVMDFQGASPNPPVLYRIDPGGVSSTFLVSPAQWQTGNAPIALAFGSAAFGQDLFVADRTGTGTIWRVDASANLSAFLTGYSVLAVAQSPGGAFGDHLYFAASDGASVDLLRVDPAGNVSLVVADIGAPHVLAALAFRDDGKALYVGVADRIVEVVPATMALVATPNAVAPNQPFQLLNTGGLANMPALLLFDQAFGVTLTPPSVLLSTGLDASGNWLLPWAAPAGLSGLSLRLQVLSIDAAGRFVVSNKETLSFL